MKDAYLWACMVGRLRDAGIDTEPAHRLARQLVAEVRRERDGKRSERRTWAPGDELPDLPPRRVADLDGAVWEHQDAGRGCYRMCAKDREEYSDSSGDYEGVQLWPYLLDSEGPLTEVLR